MLLSGAYPAFWVLALGYAWGQLASPPIVHRMPWLLHVPRILLMFPRAATTQGKPLLLGLPARHVLLFIYPLPCLLSFCPAKDH